MICLLIWATGAQLHNALSWGRDSYQITEWLINYAGGFVRRGLPGTLIGMVSNATGIQANHLAIISGLVCYLLLVVWLLLRATPIFPAVLILSCVAMGIPAYQDSIVRKDCLGLLFLLGCLAVDRGRLPGPLRLLILNLLVGTAILCHESFVFHAVAGFLLLGSRDQASMAGMNFPRRMLALLPAGICFLLTVIHHGSPEQAAAINDSWMPLWRTIEPGNPALATPDAAIEALGWTSEQGLSLSLYMLTTGWYQPTAWAMVFGITFVLVVLFTDRSSDREGQAAMQSRIQVTALLLAQLLFISPLFLLGVDYGRWLFLWVVSSMMLHTFGRRAPARVETWVARAFTIARVPELIARVPARDWYLLCFGVPVCWNLHDFLVASPLSRHFEIIRSWL
ncbi:MAG: hypothetical protein Q8Q59_03595 [Luteolibacter sp.]|nr:hypothetical protein [Luteolibacter sp.]